MSASAVIASPQPSSEAGALRVVGRTSVGGAQAVLVQVPSSSEPAFGSHLVLIWTVASHTYALGFHGLDHAAEELDKAVAADLVLVQP